MNARLLRQLAVFALFCAGLCAPAAHAQTTPGTHAAAAAAWRKEFDDVCSRTEQAMSFSIEQLTVLVERCDALQPRIDRLEETQRKVYSVRLHQCRGLYAYVLESKKNEKQEGKN
ncbi:MAG: hypothetical protein P4M01_01960 [Acidobacteriota bacterium]|nr:hypothetical protein [Acidobacteriota bacterium]